MGKSTVAINKEINLIRDTIIESLSPEKIILFGSYAHGKASRDSDIDILVVVKDHHEPRFRRSRELRKRLWGKVSVPKDILIFTSDEIREWKNVKHAFITSVLSEGKILYEKKD